MIGYIKENERIAGLALEPGGWKELGTVDSERLKC